MGNRVVHHVQTGVIELEQDEDQVETELSAPAADAPKSEWVDYATSLGYQVDGMTKAEIVDSVS